MHQGYKATPEAVRGQPTILIMNEDRVLTMAKSALRLANIIRYENGHEIIDVSLLRTIPDGELPCHQPCVGLLLFFRLA